jgi:hypothetical protein
MTDPHRRANTKSEPFRRNSTMVRRVIGFFCFAGLAGLPRVLDLLATRCFWIPDGLGSCVALLLLAVGAGLFALNVRHAYKAQPADILAVIAILPIGLYAAISTRPSSPSFTQCHGHGSVLYTPTPLCPRHCQPA